ncbi:hypothetical protein T01_14335 [Trichinella spiralis]|uniref:Uncharacterized protein n=1 Tax=Trichinella spiralis TaxID=6334 RepID=A0A0V0Z0K8_TRISP|nr:hypothetical protein T01_14335 [Trichinella spiralis]
MQLFHPEAAITDAAADDEQQASRDNLLKISIKSIKTEALHILNTSFVHFN